MTTVAYPHLLDCAVSDARKRLAAAQSTDIHDDLAVIRSHAALTAALERVLRTIDGDDEVDVAAQVDAEDGIRRPVYARYRQDEAAA
ncbi:hypothetical protein [Streptomyces sp. NPDC088258]|uniref:hypothetical protein n=1 Tax=Streptomyces sp. NPDC088258 TaxID=3365849 RepID=UPI0037FCFD18